MCICQTILKVGKSADLAVMVCQDRSVSACSLVTVDSKAKPLMSRHSCCVWLDMVCKEAGWGVSGCIMQFHSHIWLLHMCGYMCLCAKVAYCWVSVRFACVSGIMNVISSWSRNFFASRFCQPIQEKKKLLLFFKMKIVSILIIYTKHILRLVRWEWLLCFYYFFFLIWRSYISFDLHNFLSDADQNTTFSLLTYLRLTQFSSSR